MKRWMSLPLALTLILALCALPAAADTADAGVSWTLYTVESGTTADFDSDDAAETFTFSTALDEYRDGSFTLSVNDQSVTQGDCCCLSEEIYMVHIGWTGYSDMEDYGYYATLFMVPEYGPSDDPYTYCYLYCGGQLLSVGNIPALPQNMSIDRITGTFTTTVRADMLGTWARPADYKLARGYWYDEDGDFLEAYHFVEVPRPIYPMGMIVTLRQDLPLRECQTDNFYAFMLMADQDVILAATDDCRWLYVSSLDGQIAGWVRMKRVDYMTKITVADTDMEADDVFEGIQYAD